MKRTNHIFHTTLVVLCAATLWASGCNVFEIKDRPDPNNTELASVINNPTRSDLNTLVAGTLSGLRTDINLYFIDVGMVGREMYRFLSAEPRFTGDLLGKENSELDAGSFYTTRPWSAYYTNIRMTNILLEAIASESSSLTDAEINGVSGFAKTIKAYQYLMALNLTNNNGIRQQNQSDINTVGPLLNKSDAFNLINTLLDEAAGELNSAGSSFLFGLPEGFSGFTTPATFREFNRALRARVAAYQADWPAVLSSVSESFIDDAGDLTTGVYHDFTTNPNDQTNPIFADPQSGAGDSWVAHPSWRADAEAGDERIDEKIVLRNTTASLDGLTSDDGLNVYKSQTAPIPIIRNAELVLLRAEALANRNNAGDLQAAEDDINVIRNAAGLGDFDTGVPADQAAIIDEMLRQRRYELFMEGHRWIDMRRYDRLGQLPIDRAGDNVWEQFPIPENENVGS